jgi:hypothetical protein
MIFLAHIGPVPIEEFAPMAPVIALGIAALVRSFRRPPDRD